MPIRNENKKFLSFLAIITFIAFFLGCWKIYHPGLYYDELLFGNAAVGGKSNDFVRLRVMGIPFLLMDYIGALKAWIYYPIFSIFPVNPWTVRIPSLLIGLGGGVALVAALWKGFGRNAAVAGAVMILLDPTLITHSRLDWGPNALMFFFRGVMTLSMVNWIKTRDVKWAWLAIGAAALGIFDKLNFIWFASAAAASLTLLYYDDIQRFARLRPKHALALTALGAAGLGIAITRGIMIAEQTDVSWGQRLSNAFWLIRLSFCGGGALDFVSGDGIRLEHWIWPGYLLAIIVGCFGIRALYRNADDRRLHRWTILLFLITSGAFIITKTATGSHHSSILSGMWQLILAPMVGSFLDNKEGTLQPMRLWIVRLALLLVFLANVNCIATCVRFFAFPSNANWDPANTEAALFAKTHPDDTFISTDWGIGTQVITLTKDHPGIADVWPTFTKQEDADNYIKNMPKDKNVYIYTRCPGFENIKGNRDNLIHALDNSHIGHEVVMSYSDWRGKSMIEIWKVSSGTK